jgi:hypothetical protein
VLDGLKGAKGATELVPLADVLDRLGDGGQHRRGCFYRDADLPGAP